MIYEILTWGDPIEPGKDGVRACTLAGVAKSGSVYGLASEYVCSRLGLALGLPVPPGILTKNMSGEPVYVSLRFGRKGERPPPIIPDEFIEDHFEMACQVVAFDCWIANEDRHMHNLAYTRYGAPPAVFDHDQAFFGSMGPRADTLESRKDEPCWGGVLVHLLTGQVQTLPQQADVIRSVPAHLIDRACSDVEEFGLDSSESRAMSQFLKHRQRHIVSMLDRVLQPEQGWLT